MRPSLSMKQRLQTPQVWLLGILLSLIVFHLNLLWQGRQNFNPLSIKLFLWGIVLTLLWQKRHKLQLESDIVSSLLGVLLIAWGLARGLSTHLATDMLREFIPLIGGLGILFLASGIRGIKYYHQELWITAVLTIPIGPLGAWIATWIDVNTLAAKFSTFVLWYLGFEVSRQGTSVILPQGAIEIYPACSGLNILLVLLQLTVVFLLLCPIKPAQKLWVPVFAFLLGFGLNGLRLALMAVLVNTANQPAFDYWHGEAGAQILSTLSIILLGGFCHFLTQQTSSNDPDTLES